MSSLRYRAFRAYQALPEGAKRLVGRVLRRLPNRLRFGPDFDRVHAFLAESQYWSKGEMAAYQMTKLRETLEHAYNHVPYYRARMLELDINPAADDLLEVLNRLPMVNKTDALAHYQEIIPSNLKAGKIFHAHTSACQGPFMEMPRTAYAHIIERAYLLLIWEWAGYHLDEPALRLRAVDGVDQQVTYDAAQNCLEFPLAVFTDQTCRLVADKARTFKPKAIFGYPSYLFALAEAVVRLNREADFSSVKVCFAASEKLFPYQRRLIAKAFAATVSQWYGQAEQVCLAGWCPECECLHEISQYSLVEYQPIGNDPHGPAEVVGTSFLNEAFPLLRYRMNDVVTLAETPNRCGRPYPSIKEVQGRAGDFLVTPKGALVSPTSLEFSWDLVPGIQQIQILQTVPDAIVVLLVAGEGYGPDSKDLLLERLAQRIGEKIEITVEEVERIPRSGVKTRMVISQVSRERFQNVTDNPMTT